MNHKQFLLQREREFHKHTHTIAKQHHRATQQEKTNKTEYQFSDVPEKNPFSLNQLCGIANERRTERAV